MVEGLWEDSSSENAVGDAALGYIDKAPGPRSRISEALFTEKKRSEERNSLILDTQASVNSGGQPGNSREGYQKEMINRIRITVP